MNIIEPFENLLIDLKNYYASGEVTEAMRSFDKDNGDFFSDCIFEVLWEGDRITYLSHVWEVSGVGPSEDGTAYSMSFTSVDTNHETTIQAPFIDECPVWELGIILPPRHTLVSILNEMGSMSRFYQPSKTPNLSAELQAYMEENEFDIDYVVPEMLDYISVSTLLNIPIDQVDTVRFMDDVYAEYGDIFRWGEVFAQVNYSLDDRDGFYFVEAFEVFPHTIQTVEYRKDKP